MLLKSKRTFLIPVVDVEFGFNVVLAPVPLDVRLTVVVRDDNCLFAVSLICFSVGGNLLCNVVDVFLTSGTRFAVVRGAAVTLDGTFGRNGGPAFAANGAG